MKHAGPAALDTLLPPLAQLRGLPTLQERSRGVFYRKSRAFLHFHEDASGLFADLRIAGDFVRFDVSGRPGQVALLTAVEREISEDGQTRA